MLYRPRRFPIARLALAAFAHCVRWAVTVRRVHTDAAYFDCLNDDALRELGIQRIVTHDGRFYR